MRHDPPGETDPEGDAASGQDAPGDRARTERGTAAGSSRTERPSAGPTWGDARPGGGITDLDEVQRSVGERYRVDHLAGSGGMSQVFAATDLEHNRRVAIKFLRVSGSQDLLEARRRTRGLMAEARAMAQLDHPGLCRVTEVKMDDHRAFIVMNWIDGVSLSTYARERSTNERVAVFVKLAEAVSAIHAEGIVHGDLKPANVLVTQDGSPVLVDFGLAVTETDPNSTARTGGTPGYAAPEQFDSTQPVGPQADVFALGVLLYELLTDRLPFGPGSTARILDEIQRLDPPPPRAIVSDAPADIQRVCLAAMGADPTTRYADASALLDDLRRSLEGAGPIARPRSLFAPFASDLELANARVSHWAELGMLPRETPGRVRRVLRLAIREDASRAVAAERASERTIARIGGAVLVIGIGVVAAASPNGWTAWVTAALTLALAASATLMTIRPGRTPFAALGSFAIAGTAPSAAIALIALAAWQVLRLSGWLAPSSEIVVARGNPDLIELTTRFGASAVPSGASNLQLLTTAVVSACVAALFRFRRSAAGPRWLLAFAVAAAWALVYPLFGRLWQSTGEIVGEWALWMAVYGAVWVVLAIEFDRSEQRRAVARPDLEPAASDAAPWLAVSLASLAGGLGVLVSARPAWAWGFAAPPIRDLAVWNVGSPADVTAALVLNAVVLTLASWLLGASSTPRRSAWSRGVFVLAGVHLAAAGIVPTLLIDGPLGWWSGAIGITIGLLLLALAWSQRWHRAGILGGVVSAGAIAALAVRSTWNGTPAAPIGIVVALLGAALLAIAVVIPKRRAAARLRAPQDARSPE